MKKKTLLYIAGGIVLVLLVLLVILLTQQKDKSIGIKTKLSPDEVVSKVKLTSGTLNFKTDTDVYAELSEEERNAYKPKPSDYFPEYDKGFTVNEEDISRVLNLDPAKWRIPDRMKFHNEHFNRMIGLVSGETPEQDYSDDVLYFRLYENEDSSCGLSIEVALPGRRWIRDTEIVGLSAQHVKAVYGNLDSRIGDMPLSVLIRDNNAGNRYLDAYFIAGNAAYFIRAFGMTQQEFVELLISIYEAPRPVTQEPISALYDVAVAK